MDKAKKTAPAKPAASAGAAKKKPPAKKVKKTTTAEKSEVKTAQAAVGGQKAPKKANAAAAGGAAPKKKAVKKEKKDKREEVQIMTLEMVEAKFERQTKAYNQRILSLMRGEQRPLTLPLIFKYAFPKPKQPKKAQSEEQSQSAASTRDDTSVSASTQGASKGGYQISSVLEEFLDSGKQDDDSKNDASGKKKLGFYEGKEASDSDASDGQEDKEALLVQEKTRIDEALKESQQTFVKEAIAAKSKGAEIVAIQPKIQRRLGVGLAALLQKRKEEEQSEAGSKTPAQSEKKAAEVLSDDDDFYGEEEAEDDLGVKKALAKKKRREEMNKKKEEEAMRRKLEEAEKAKQEEEAAEDDEDDSSGSGESGEDSGEDDDEPIGKGFDDDGEVDLSEITEADVLQKKLELMQEELEQRYEDGLESYQDPEKLIQLKHLRLSFLNIGPNIQNLEFFENLENLLLQQNEIEEIGKTSLQFNLNLQMLNLSHNKITKLQGLTHLDNLIFFNISHNLIEEFDPKNELPKNLQIVRMTGNPIEKNDAKYREKIVVALDDLCELDKVKVIQAERLFYKGLLPRHLKFSIQDKLEQFKRERREEEAREKMEYDLYSELMDEQGISQQTRIKKELDEYEKMDDEGKIQSQFENIIQKVLGQRQTMMAMHRERYGKIEEQLKMTLQKYPALEKRMKELKDERKDLGAIEEEADDGEEQDDAEQNLKRSRKRKVAFAQEIVVDGDDDDDDAEGEIDFETYKKQFEAEIAEKIKIEKMQEETMSQAILDKAKGLKYKIEQQHKQIIS